MSKLGYRVMAATLRWFKKEPYMRERLEFAGINEGHVVLDYGSGPGYFAFLAAEMVGPGGRVYAADIEPMVRDYVEEMKRTKGLDNIETIITDCDTSLPDKSVDRALLFDIIHHLEDPTPVLGEIRRVLKDDGVLCVDIHHMEPEEAIRKVEGIGFLKSGERERTVNFTKNL
jgi:ubiquinone/menaquinone biosynthesis C-methylase UbiE